MRSLFVLGRAVFGGFFVYNGYIHYRDVAQMTGYAAARGVPAPAAAVRASGAMLIAGGLSVISGAKPKQGLATLVAFLIPSALQIHRFWEESDPMRQAQERAHFLKDIALAGAALALMQVSEPWPASIDALRADDEEMFVHLGGRDLRALPA
jgi:uncharacterized membrane protein YphA (DoxX/SURF4 family)